MNRNEFNEAITKLKRAFGDKHYPDERTEGLWSSFNKTDAFTFRMAVSYAIENERSAPLLDKLKSYVSKTESSSAVSGANAVPTKLLGCDKCRFMGFVLRRNRDDNVAAFRCNCALAASYKTVPPVSECVKFGYPLLMK